MMKRYQKMADRDDWYLAMREAEAARLARMARAEQERRRQMINTLRHIIDAAFVVICVGLVLFCVYLTLWGGR